MSLKRKQLCANVSNFIRHRHEVNEKGPSQTKKPENQATCD